MSVPFPESALNHVATGVDIAVPVSSAEGTVLVTMSSHSCRWTLAVALAADLCRAIFIDEVSLDVAECPHRLVDLADRACHVLLDRIVWMDDASAEEDDVLQRVLLRAGRADFLGDRRCCSFHRVVLVESQVHDLFDEVRLALLVEPFEFELGEIGIKWT